MRLVRFLGRSGIEVSALGLGCWAIGGPFEDQGGWMGYGTVDDAESRRALHRAIDLGVTFFDTSDVYGCGHSERLLGQVLGEHRHQMVITAKFGYTFDEARRCVTGKDGSPAYIQQACEASLRRLGRDYIDVYQFHLHDYDLARAAEVRDTLEHLVAQGKIRFYAWATEDPDRIRLFAAGDHCTASPQLLNLVDANQQTLDLCDEFDLACIARRPLGMGLLTGKYNAGSTFAENDMRRRFHWNLKDGKQAQILHSLNQVQALLTRENRTLVQGALGWVWARHPRAIPIPGFKTVAQVEENLKALDFGPLSTEDFDQIERIKSVVSRQ